MLVYYLSYFTSLGKEIDFILFCNEFNKFKSYTDGRILGSL